MSSFGTIPPSINPAIAWPFAKGSVPAAAPGGNVAGPAPVQPMQPVSPAAPVANPATISAVWGPTPKQGEAKNAPVLAVIANPTKEQRERALQVLQEYTSTRGRQQQAGTKEADGHWNRGLIAFDTRVIPEGLEVYIYSGHEQADDKINFTVSVRVAYELGGQTYEQMVAIAPTQQTCPNPTQGGQKSFEGIQRLVIKKDEIEAYLAQHAPQAKGLKLESNADIVVSANWAVGHRWGGVDRDGIIKYEAGELIQAGSRQPLRFGGPVERDYSVPLTRALVQDHPVLQMQGAASYKSHLESESKAQVPFAKFRALYDMLMTLSKPQDAAAQAKAQAMMTEIFGAEAPKWKAKAVETYWNKDGAGAVKKDPFGFIDTNAFTDLYLDTATRELGRREMAARVRSILKERLSFENWNFKPTPGKRDEASNVTNRVEVECPMAQGSAYNPGAVLDFLLDEAHPLSPGRLLREEDPTFSFVNPNDPDNSGLFPAGHVIGRRFKFEFEHENGVAFEVSLDAVAMLAVGIDGLPVKVDETGKVTPNGKFYAVSCYGQMEMELAHLNFNNGGQKGGQAQPPAGAGNNANQPSIAGRWYQAPNAVGPQQEAFLKALPASASLSGSVRTHSVKDANDPAILAEASYQQFVKAVPALQELLLGGKINDPNGAMSTMQKYAMGARLAGVIPMTVEERKQYAGELKATAEFRRAFATPQIETEIARATKLVQDAEANAQKTLGDAKKRLDTYLAAQQAQRAVSEARIKTLQRDLASVQVIGLRSPRFRLLTGQIHQAMRELTNIDAQTPEAAFRIEREAAETALRLRSEAQRQAQEILRAALVTVNPLASLPGAMT